MDIINKLNKKGNVTMEDILYHGSKMIVSEPEIRKSRFTKDFSWGFYCTNRRKQAEIWSVRHCETGYVSVYKFHKRNDLKIKVFSTTDAEWLDFVAKCRNGDIHEYDIVEGPMADDTIYNYVEDYLDGKISKDDFLQLAKFKHPTHQISFHTKAYIVLKCSGKSYTTTASVSGYWKIDTKKPLGRNRIEMKVYKKGKVIAKYWKEYQKESSVTDKNDDQNNAASAVHKHFYNIPVYKTVHFDEAGHYETIISSGSYYEKEVSHDICDTCVKDLTQEYINGIKDGTYKKVEIPKNDENTSSSKSRDILDDYKEIRWSNDMPLYEDFIAYGGWNHTCSDHKLTEQTETIMAYFPGAIRKDWIVDQKAHDEQVVIGYQCSCGDIHEVENN